MDLERGYDWRPSRRLTVSCWRDQPALTFTLLHLACDRLPTTGTVEGGIAVCGLHLQVTYVYDPRRAAAWTRDLQARLAAIEAARDGEAA